MPDAHAEPHLVLEEIAAFIGPNCPPIDPPPAAMPERRSVANRLTAPQPRWRHPCRILCEGLRLNGKQQGESARCAYHLATRQGRDLDRHRKTATPGL